MTTPKYSKKTCMRFAASVDHEDPIVRKNSDARTIRRNKLTKREILNLFFEICDDCSKMAAIPQGAFAAHKVRENNKRRILVTKMENRSGNDKESKQETGYSNKASKEEGRELTPLKYNSKLMNSIWGLYNRYSVHNFKKNTDAEDEIVAAAGWGPATNRNRPPTSSTVERSAAATVQQLLGTRNFRL